MKIKQFLAAAFLGVIIAVLFVIITMPPGGPFGVAGVTTRGGYMIAIRSPPTPDGQVQFIIFDDDPYISPKTVTSGYIEGGAQFEGQEILLSQSQWNAVDNLRKKWYDSVPVFSNLDDGALFYDVGFRCEGPGGMFSKRVKIPLNELPLAF